MDDFEKKELEGEATCAEELEVKSDSAEDAVAVSDADELKRELEEIRDMFQEAIDNASQDDIEDIADGELIQELDYNEESALEEAEELPLCECCESNPVSTLHGEGYPYCEECREVMKRYPLRIGGVVAIIAMIAIFSLSAYFGMNSFENAIVVLEAQSNASQGKMMSAVQSLYNFTSSAETDSKKATKLLIDGFIRTGYINNAKETIEKYYTEDELNRASNKKYKKVVDFVDSFLQTRDATQDIVSGAFSGADFDCDKLVEELEKSKEKFLDEENGIKYNSALIDYYKYELYRLSKADLSKQLEVLKEIESNDPDGLCEWIYLPSICEVASKMGNKELAEACFEKMKKNNSEDMAAYTTFALYYRFLETPDADAIISLCDEAAKNAYEGDLSYYPTLVIAYLIKGEGALAFDTMTQFMNSGYYSVSNCNLYALCALYCGDTETYKNMKTTLKSYGYEISDTVEKYKNKKITLENVIADMRGEIG